MATSLALLSPIYSNAENYNVATDDSSKTQDSNTNDTTSEKNDSSNTENRGYFKKDLSRLKKLSEIKITSVSKQPEDPFTAPAAVYVITSEDIKRSGATSIPEILRLAPGIQVAQMGANRWAVAARGNNDTITNKLLVLIDGRSVYTPVFAGVNWDAQGVLIEDIKQIEVIRGPAGTLWGANAVNGVINIITEDTVNTLEKQVNVTYGNNQNIESARAGGEINKYTSYRVYAKRSDHAPSELVNGNDNRDAWNSNQAGFRVDLDKTSQDLLTIQGDTYDTKTDRLATLPTITTPYSLSVIDGSHISGANILGRYAHTFDSGSNYTLQSYIDHTERNFSITSEDVSTFDVDFQHNLFIGKRNDITWGAGYRLTQQEEPATTYFTFTPSQRSDGLLSTFVQDKITLLPEKVFLTLGSKFEYNDYTNFEAQPSARLAWTPNKDNTLWAAVSKAVRTPSSAEESIHQIVGVVQNVGYIAFVGDGQMKSENLISYEVGLKNKSIEHTSFDISAFYNDYSNLRTFEAGSTAIGNIVVPLYVRNMGKANSYGTEFSATWDATNNWQLTGAYSFLITDIRPELGSNDTSLIKEQGQSPKHQFNIRSHLKLAHNVELDNMLYYVDSLHAINIPGYERFDSRIAWKPLEKVELSLVGQNLLNEHHKEFTEIPVLAQTEVGRTVYAKVSVRF